MTDAKIKPWKEPKMSWRRDFKKNWPIYVILLPAVLYIVVLSYLPMFGIIMAFEDYSVSKGYFGSTWVGLQNFIDLFTGEDFPRAIRNTIVLTVLKATVSFVMPIIFALFLSLLKSKKYKRTVQTMSYLPNFVATVVVATLVTEFLGQGGPLTLLISKVFGAADQNWLANSNIPVFWVIYIGMGIWQGIGWGSIMYVAAIATVSGDLHEAAAIDGASRLQRIWRITIPCILPMVVMMFVLNVAVSFAAGYDSILLLYMPTTYSVSDTVYTYTYRMAFTSGNNYGLSAASGLFQSIVGTALLLISNALSRKLTDTSLF